MGLTIRPWEKELIRDIDDIARQIWIKKINSKERTPLNEIDISDTAKIGAFLRGKMANQQEG